MTKTKKQSKKTWEEEFDVKFNHFNANYFGTGGTGKQICDSCCSKAYDLEDVKHFISDLLKKEREKGQLQGYGRASNLYAFGKIEKRAREKMGKALKLKFEENFAVKGMSIYEEEEIVSDFQETIDNYLEKFLKKNKKSP